MLELRLLFDLSDNFIYRLRSMLPTLNAAASQSIIIHLSWVVIVMINSLIWGGAY